LSKTAFRGIPQSGIITCPSHTSETQETPGNLSLALPERTTYNKSRSLEDEMKRILFISLLFVVCLTMTLHAQTGLSPDKVPRMTIQELKQQMDNPNLIIIDVRSSHDWEDSTMKIKGSVREEASKVATWISKYPPTKTIVLHCA
jgi:hypothetical protein